MGDGALSHITPSTTVPANSSPGSATFSLGPILPDSGRWRCAYCCQQRRWAKTCAGGTPVNALLRKVGELAAASEILTPWRERCRYGRVRSLQLSRKVALPSGTTRLQWGQMGVLSWLSELIRSCDMCAWPSRLRVNGERAT